MMMDFILIFLFRAFAVGSLLFIACLTKPIDLESFPAIVTNNGFVMGMSWLYCSTITLVTIVWIIGILSAIAAFIKDLKDYNTS